MMPLVRRSPGSRGPVRSLYVAVVATGLLLLGMPGAGAHDELTDSEPAANASVEQPPTELTLSFSTELATLGTQLQVNGPQGSATEGDPVIEGSQVSQPLTTVGQPGDYEVIWRVTSQDGHPVSGSFGYTVEAVEGDVEDPQTEDTDTDTDAEESEESATQTAQSTEPEGTADTETEDPQSTQTEDSDDPTTEDSADTETEDPTSTQTEDLGETDQDADTATQEPEDTAQQSGEPTPPTDTQTGVADNAARTDAVLIDRESSSAGGMSLWMWGLVGVALLALAGVGTMAVRRR